MVWWCRAEQHAECDQRLESELESLRIRTAAEIEQLKTQTREMYERENRVLVQTRDAAITEREKAKQSEKEAIDKYDRLVME